MSAGNNDRKRALFSRTRHRSRSEPGGVDNRSSRRDAGLGVRNDGAPEIFHDSIWSRQREHGQRGQPTLSYESIVRAAIDLADTEGPKALSMRGLATKLGVGTMSIYWYVPSKDDLLDLVVDAVRGEIEVPDPGADDWRTNSSVLAHNTRRVLLQHQWMVNLAAVGPPVGPHTLNLVDNGLAFFDHTGADPMTVVSSFMAIDTFVMGYVMREQQEQANDHHERALSHEEIENLAEIYHDYMQEYPHIQKMIRSGIDPDSPDTRDARFEFGLECLLDGIAARLPSK